MPSAGAGTLAVSVGATSEFLAVVAVSEDDCLPWQPASKRPATAGTSHPRNVNKFISKNFLAPASDLGCPRPGKIPNRNQRGIADTDTTNVARENAA